MKQLTQEELDNLSNLSNDKILRMFTRWSDRVFLINKQNDSGIANKSDSDPDVAKLKSDYQAIRTEIKSRAGNKNLSDDLDNLETNSNLISWNSAQGKLGIPSHEKTESEVNQAKQDKTDLWSNLERRLK